MKKYVINFSGENVGFPCTHTVKIDPKNGWEEIMMEVSRGVDQVRDAILDAKKNGISVTLVLPDHGPMAVGIVQAVRGLTGSIPFVQGPGTDEVDTESIREAFRESLT